MSSLFTSWFSFTIPNALHLLTILVFAMLLNRLLREMTNLLIKPAAAQTRAAQARELQTRALADSLYQVSSKIVWGVAVLTALPEFGISVLPAVAIMGLALLGLGFGAQTAVRDLIAGFHIAFENQYSVGDTIQALHALGRVEQLTLRRTVLRDARGALVTLANGDIRAVANLSRDWSQAFVDVSVAAEEPLDRTLQALEAASAQLRSDPSWSQALVDGPRVLGMGVQVPRCACKCALCPPARTKSAVSSAAGFKLNFSAKALLYRVSKASKLFPPLKHWTRCPNRGPQANKETRKWLK